jgi:hypothetical protein
VSSIPLFPFYFHPFIIASHSTLVIYLCDNSLDDCIILQVIYIDGGHELSMILKFMDATYFVG